MFQKEKDLLKLVIKKEVERQLRTKVRTSLIVNEKLVFEVLENGNFDIENALGASFAMTGSGGTTMGATTGSGVFV